MARKTADEEETVILTPFRLVFMVVTTMDGYEAPASEQEEHSRMELVMEVQGQLGHALAKLNQEHDLNLGVVDLQIRSIPGYD